MKQDFFNNDGYAEGQYGIVTLNDHDELVLQDIIYDTVKDATNNLDNFDSPVAIVQIFRLI